ncbi:putative reverse transcriptase zinc-binding domain-containing protein [Helianthus annuus]|nr:putative reverse transcriptase zinc-binding domain-containing protein [Helianthus annuus]
MTATVGNGRSIRLWTDVWVLNVQLKDRFPLLFLLSKNKNSMVADTVKVVDGAVTLVWDWLRNPSSTEELEQLQNYSNLLFSAGYNEQIDKWLWKGSKDGMFSVGSVKKELQISNHHVGFYAHEWCKWIPAKCNIFAWRAEMERLPTRVELRKRKINIEKRALCFFLEFKRKRRIVFSRDVQWLRMFGKLYLHGAVFLTFLHSR